MSSPRRRRGIEGLMAGEPQRERADPHLPVCLEGEVTRVDGDHLWARIRRLDGSGLREVGPCAWQRPIDWLEIGWDLADPGPPHEYDDGTVEPAGSGPHTHTVDIIGWRTDPPSGTRCLIGFADGRLERPWVVAFVGWPRRG